MTGKEDLFEKSTTCVDIGNDVWDNLNFEIMKLLKKENKELKQKLTKYERAFEILKEKFKIQLSNDVIESVDMNDNPKTYYIYQVMFVYDRAIYAHDLEQKEYELLEELMKGER